MSIFTKVRDAVAAVAPLRPLLRVLGVKGGTVVDKFAEAAEVADQVLPKPRKHRKRASRKKA